MPVRLNASAVVLLAMAGVVLAGSPSAPRRTFPGEARGFAEARWIAPFVFSTVSSTGKGFGRDVRWYDDQGKVVKEIDGLSNETGSDFVLEPREGGIIIHGTSGLWDLREFSQGDPRSRGDRLAGNGDTFAHLYHSESGEAFLGV